MVAAATLAVPTLASAQRWQPINQRQDNLYNRIERGVQNGTLTRREARNLRNRFAMIERMEVQYRRNGLNNWERRDLNRRFDALSGQIRDKRRNGQYRRYG